MKAPYDKIFDTICHRVQFEKDRKEYGQKNEYNKWQSFLQRYMEEESYLDKGER